MFLDNFDDRYFDCRDLFRGIAQFLTGAATGPDTSAEVIASSAAESILSTARLLRAVLPAKEWAVLVPAWITVVRDIELEKRI